MDDQTDPNLGPSSNQNPSPDNASNPENPPPETSPSSDSPPNSSGLDDIRAQIANVSAQLNFLMNRFGNVENLATQVPGPSNVKTEQPEDVKPNVQKLQKPIKRVKKPAEEIEFVDLTLDSDDEEVPNQGNLPQIPETSNSNQIPTAANEEASRVKLEQAEATTSQENVNVVAQESIQNDSQRNDALVQEQEVENDSSTVPPPSQPRQLPSEICISCNLPKDIFKLGRCRYCCMQYYRSRPKAPIMSVKREVPEEVAENQNADSQVENDPGQTTTRKKSINKKGLQCKLCRFQIRGKVCRRGPKVFCTLCFSNMGKLQRDCLVCGNFRYHQCNGRCRGCWERMKKGEKQTMHHQFLTQLGQEEESDKSPSPPCQESTQSFDHQQFSNQQTTQPFQQEIPQNQQQTSSNQTYTSPQIPTQRDKRGVIKPRCSICKFKISNEMFCPEMPEYCKSCFVNRGKKFRECVVCKRFAAHQGHGRCGMCYVQYRQQHPEAMDEDPESPPQNSSQNLTQSPSQIQPGHRRVSFLNPNLEIDEFGQVHQRSTPTKRSSPRKNAQPIELPSAESCLLQVSSLFGNQNLSSNCCNNCLLPLTAERKDRVSKKTCRLCVSQKNNRHRVCVICGEYRLHHGKGRCVPCYNRYRQSLRRSGGQGNVAPEIVEMEQGNLMVRQENVTMIRQGNTVSPKRKVIHRPGPKPRQHHLGDDFYQCAKCSTGYQYIAQGYKASKTYCPNCFETVNLFKCTGCHQMKRYCSMDKCRNCYMNAYIRSTRARKGIGASVVQKQKRRFCQTARQVNLNDCAPEFSGNMSWPMCKTCCIRVNPGHMSKELPEHCGRCVKKLDEPRHSVCKDCGKIKYLRSGGRCTVCHNRGPRGNWSNPNTSSVQNNDQSLNSTKSERINAYSSSPASQSSSEESDTESSPETHQNTKFEAKPYVNDDNIQIQMTSSGRRVIPVNKSPGGLPSAEAQKSQVPGQRDRYKICTGCHQYKYMRTVNQCDVCVNKAKCASNLANFAATSNTNSFATPTNFNASNSSDNASRKRQSISNQQTLQAKECQVCDVKIGQHNICNKSSLICNKCFDEKTTDLRICGECKEICIPKANGFCKECFEKKLEKEVERKRMETPAPADPFHPRNEMSQSSSNPQQQNDVFKCSVCNQASKHVGRQMCKCCYNRWYEKNMRYKNKAQKSKSSTPAREDEQPTFTTPSGRFLSTPQSTAPRQQSPTPSTSSTSNSIVRQCKSCQMELNSKNAGSLDEQLCSLCTRSQRIKRMKSEVADPSSNQPLLYVCKREPTEEDIITID